VNEYEKRSIGITMRRRWRWLLVALAFSTVLAAIYVRTHPLVFMDTHVHCIKYAGLQLEQYASEHQGRFPYDPRGYGNAILLMNEDCFDALTGPGYDAAPLREAKRTGAELPEEECGRVYVQGLTRKSDSEIALLFDKLPTPGGDHCPLPVRLWAPLGREVWTIGCGMVFVRESNWQEFTRRQVDLLVIEGFDREAAEGLFASKPK
jgi:hypothetical protein